MQTDTILNGILALLVAERDRTGRRPTEHILAEAGLTDEHIAMLTGRAPARLDLPPATAFGHSAPAASRQGRGGGEVAPGRRPHAAVE